MARMQRLFKVPKQKKEVTDIRRNVDYRDGRYWRKVPVRSFLENVLLESGLSDHGWTMKFVHEEQREMGIHEKTINNTPLGRLACDRTPPGDGMGLDIDFHNSKTGKRKTLILRPRSRIEIEYKGYHSVNKIPDVVDGYLLQLNTVFLFLDKNCATYSFAYPKDYIFRGAKQPWNHRDKNSLIAYHRNRPTRCVRPKRDLQFYHVRDRQKPFAQVLTEWLES